MKTHSFSCLDEDSSSDNGYYGTPSPENKRKRPKRKSTELLSFHITVNARISARGAYLIF